MFSSVKKALLCIKKKPDDDDSDNDEATAIHDELLWSRDLDRHFFGEFSMAVAQANEVLEDKSQVETRYDFTFVGVYDGHNGPYASTHICNTLFDRLICLYQQHREISEDIIREALFETETRFINRVRSTLMFQPALALVGSCCLVGVIFGGTLYVANIGNSRAVMGSLVKADKIRAEQLTRDHNINSKIIRQELRALHSDDLDVVVYRDGGWWIKGLIQVSRSIGDAYLKYPDLAAGPDPITCSVLTSEPDIHFRALNPTDRFVIFASDGLWEHISNEAAVETVHKHPRPGIAKRLVKMAMKAAARKSKISYNELKGKEKGNRRNCHDDITVAVIFIEYEMLSGDISVPDVSVRGFPVPDEIRVSSPGADTACPLNTSRLSNTAGPSSSGASTAEPSSSGANRGGHQVLEDIEEEITWNVWT